MKRHATTIKTSGKGRKRKTKNQGAKTVSLRIVYLFFWFFYQVYGIHIYRKLCG